MQQPVRAILAARSREVETVAPSDSVSQVVQCMNQHHIGSVLVMQDNKLVGIFTERDVLMRVVAAHRDPDATRVEEVMTRDVVTIAPETTVEKAMFIVTEKRCRHLPVLEDGKVIGLISIGDLTRWVIRDQRHQIDDLVAYVRS